jgi:putative peptidoglycan lipid II flippase
VGLLGQATVKLFASGFYALRDTRTPVKIAASSLLLATGLAALLMQRYGVAGVALGSSLAAWVNVVLQLRGLERRIGALLGRSEWRAVAVTFGASIAATAVGAGVAALSAETGTIPRALLSLGMFGVTYGGSTLALKHPDATRLWKFVS